MTFNGIIMSLLLVNITMYFIQLYSIYYLLEIHDFIIVYNTLDSK